MGPRCARSGATFPAGGSAFRETRHPCRCTNQVHVLASMERFVSIGKSRKQETGRCWRTLPSPALSTPAVLGANQVSQTRQRSMFKWIRARPTMKGRKCQLLRILCIGEGGQGSRPSTSPSLYCGRKTDMNAKRWEASAAWVCSIPNVGSCLRSFCSTVYICVKSSSSSEDAAAVF